MRDAERCRECGRAAPHHVAAPHQPAPMSEDAVRAGETVNAWLHRSFAARGMTVPPAGKEREATGKSVKGYMARGDSYTPQENSRTGRVAVKYGDFIVRVISCAGDRGERDESDEAVTSIHELICNLFIRSYLRTCARRHNHTPSSSIDRIRSRSPLQL